VLGDDGHLDEQGLQEGLLDAQFVHLFQVPDGVPAVVAGSDHQFGAGGQDLVPLDLQADVALLPVDADAV